MPAEGLSAPPLLFWSAFMEPAERFVVFPDRNTHAKLEGLDGPGLLAAKDFDGNPILAPDYADETNAGNISTAVRNTMTLSRGARTRGARNSAYSLHDDKGAFTIDLQGDIASWRHSSPIAIPLTTDRHWCFEVSAGGTHYEDLTPEQAQAVRAQRSARVVRRGSAWSLWRALESGAAKLVKVVITTAKEVVNDVANAAEALIDMVTEAGSEFVSLIVETAEHAAILAQAVLRAVTTGIVKVVQAFSYLFDWEHVKTVNREIQDLVHAGVEALRGEAFKQELADFAGKLQGQLAGVAGTINSSVDSLCEALGATTLNDPSFAGAPDSRQPTPQSQMNGVKQSWMLDKIMGAVRTLESAAIPPLVPPSVGAGLIDPFIQACAAGGDLFASDLATTFLGIKDLAPSQVVSGMLASALHGIAAALEGLLAALSTMVEDLVGQIEALADGIWAALTTKLPLGALGQFLGIELTVLDLVTLPMAVPLTLARGAMQRRSLNGVLVFAAGVAGMGSALNGFIQTVLGVLKKWPESQKIGAAVSGIVDTVAILLTMGAVAAGADPLNNTTDLILGVVNLVFTAAHTAVYFASRALGRPAIFVTCIGFVGVGFLVLLVGIAAKDHGQSPWAQRGRIMGFGAASIVRSFEFLLELQPPSCFVIRSVIALSVNLLAGAAIVFDPSWNPLLANDQSDANIRSLGEGGGERVAVMNAPTTPLQFAAPGDPPSDAVLVDTLGYAVTFFSDFAETPRSPWSISHDVVVSGPIQLQSLPLDPSALAIGRRIYRLTARGVSLVGVVEDNTTTAFVDGAPLDGEQPAWVQAFPERGYFVIGDGQAVVGASVTFWGAQWAAGNKLSGGQAPSAFKGFATQSASPQCGGTWTGDTGNSGHPPGALPNPMAVFVASHVQQFGSSISGDITKLALVQVSAGYQPNPGHAGTGEIVAIYDSDGAALADSPSVGRGAARRGKARPGRA
ncbi:MAG: hypothetical protein KC431_04200 [Myxococcales bacterium]|nr:hypothetical protein [Myxococcales bacterium]